MSEEIKLEDVSISLTADNIDDVNMTLLRAMFEKSVAVLTSSLFAQAGRESQRIEKLSKLIGRVEDDLFSEDTYSKLDYDQRISLYTTSSRNKVNSQQFMNKLQANISSGMETIASLEDRNAAQVSKNRKLLGEEETAEKNDILALLRNKIAEKIKDK
jgi:murein L,D-transpeptidase YcbB/YkuD